MVAGQPVYIHAADVAKLFRLYFELVNKNEYGDIDAGHRLIVLEKARGVAITMTDLLTKKSDRPSSGRA